MERNSIAARIGLESATEILHSNEDFGPIKKGETDYRDAICRIVIQERLLTGFVSRCRSTPKSEGQIFNVDSRLDRCGLTSRAWHRSRTDFNFSAQK